LKAHATTGCPTTHWQGLAAWQEKEDAWLTRLEGIPTPTEIGSRDWVTYGLLKEQLESAVSTRICRDELWAASTTTSWHTWIPFVFDIQPLETPELRAQALTRFAAMDTYIDNEIDNLREGLRLGYSAPRVTVEAVPAQVRSLHWPRQHFPRAPHCAAMMPRLARPRRKSITKKSRPP
jgi:uncharacterized protein (DUF885 family)